MRVYTEWLSGDAAWEMQVCNRHIRFLVSTLRTNYTSKDSLPQGATLLGTVLSSDKTNISAMTGNRIAHPLLISLANLKMNFRMKSSNHAFLLLALLPVPSFIHKNKRLRGMLGDRLVHECLHFVIQPLRTAARIGIMMSDPLGWRRFCFTPLAAYIVDTPESTLIAGVAGKTSSVTLATYKQLGDNFRHEPRTASTTLAQLHVVEEKADPWDLEAYFKAASQFHLNGVHRPFWVDWAMSDPSIFLTPEPLHHWHKAFWDHDVKWCIYSVGAAELDFRFSVLHQHVGFRHFKEGISSLKQVTGREHREVQRYIVSVIADVVPPDFLIAIRALMDFRYLAQSMQIDEQMCGKIDAALKEFHAHKNSIIAAGARRGKSHVIDNWYIPKLEFLQSVVPSIRANGIALQWSADGTERAHIEVIKNPSDFSNNQKYESQICRHLDRVEKCQRFDLFTAVRDARVDFRARSEEDDSDCASVASDDSTIETTANLVDQINPVSALLGKSLPSHVDYFAKAADLEKAPPSGQVPQAQPHTFSSPQAAFHLNRDPSFNMPINDIATLFNIPDLHDALSDYMQRISKADDGYIRVLGGRRSARGSQLPFTHLRVWKKFRLQNKAYHYPHETLPSKTVNACPPSSEWEFGRYDPVIVNLDPNCEWPLSGLEGLYILDFGSLVLNSNLSRSSSHRIVSHIPHYSTHKIPLS
jgi:Plavaka transposase